eukprot:scaffold110752_cov22-Tisochrysis_lutea.AAC.1
MDVGVEWHSGPQPGVHIAGTHLPGSSGSGDDGMGVKEGPSSTGSSCTSTSRSGQWASFSCYQLHVFDMVESAASAAAVLAAHVQPLDALGGARKPDGRAAPVSQQGAVAATDAAAAAAAAACASHEFAAIPSQLPQHSAQHSWPIPLWPPLPAALSQRTCSQDLPPARMGYGHVTSSRFKEMCASHEAIGECAVQLPGTIGHGVLLFVVILTAFSPSLCRPTR